MLSIATSLDALAVGGLAVFKTSILQQLVLLDLLLFSYVLLSFVGHKFGNLFQKKSRFFGINSQYYW